MNKVHLVILNITFILYGILLYNYALDAQWSWLIIPAVLLAWFNADFILALAHFYLDYVALPRNLELKALTESTDRNSSFYVNLKNEKMQHLNFTQKVAFDFKTHHLYPNALGKRSFISMISESTIVLVFPIVLVINIGLFFGLIHHIVLLHYIVLSIGLSLGQYAHANTHREKVPLLVSFLQKTYVFLPKKLHELHHDRFTQSFCVLNGWSNKMVNKIAYHALHKKWLDVKNLELY